MAATVPARLTELLNAPDPVAREAAWEQFLAEFSRIILQAARNGASSHDEAMDRYAFALDKLRADEYGRLRSFQAEGPGQFSTWLFLVTRRLSVDHHRQRYGRRTGTSEGEDGRSRESRERAARRRLVDLLSEEMELDHLPDNNRPDPEAQAWLEERRGALGEALASLEPRDQLLVTLRFVDEVSVRKIARAMRFDSPFQAYRRLNNVLAQLRTHLEGRGISEL